MDGLAACAPPEGTPYAIDTKEKRIEPRRLLFPADWDELIGGSSR